MPPIPISEHLISKFSWGGIPLDPLAYAECASHNVNTLCIYTCNYNTPTLKYIPMPLDCVCFYHLLKTKHCCLYPNGRYNLPLAANPSPLPTLPIPLYTPLSTHPSSCEKVAQNLASQQKQL